MARLVDQHAQGSSCLCLLIPRNTGVYHHAQNFFFCLNMGSGLEFRSSGVWNPLFINRSIAAPGAQPPALTSPPDDHSGLFWSSLYTAALRPDCWTVPQTPATSPRRGESCSHTQKSAPGGQIWRTFWNPENWASVRHRGSVLTLDRARKQCLYPHFLPPPLPQQSNQVLSAVTVFHRPKLQTQSSPNR